MSNERLSIEYSYDKRSPKSIEAYASRLIGKSFREIVEANAGSVSKEDKNRKGNLGEIIERDFFRYECNSISEPDFAEAGVELKVSPYRINNKGEIVAKERLVLTMIDYFTVVKEKHLEDSHLWHKCRLMLLIYYRYIETIKERLDYRIYFSKLFTPPERDLKIIRNDYDYIVNKIRTGKAHELSEADTLYLGACSKATKGTDRRKQPYNDIPARPRAFAFKVSYMTYVLNHYINSQDYESILKEPTEETFEQYVINRISRFRGYEVKRLCEMLDVNTEEKSKTKNLFALLTYKMLGIKNNKAEEFEKAGIVIKTIRIEENNKIKESMSFPAFKFKELVEEEWEDCTFGNYLRETKFLFVVYRHLYGEGYFLQGCQFWNIPYKDLEDDVRKVWERTKEVVKDGIELKYVNGRLVNNLPKMSENRVCHVRPHARNKLDTYELPNGQQFPKQCFWLKNTYIYSQLEERLK